MQNRVDAFVGIGANLGDPVDQVRSACRALGEDLPETRLLRCSRLYRNPPMGPQDQPDYVNAVVWLQCGLSAFALLQGLQAIEQRMGRVRNGDRWGPRLIDLDLLVFGDQVINEPGLHVPHPGLPERDFVLFPLCEIAPDLLIPQYGSVLALCAGRETSSLVPIAL